MGHRSEITKTVSQVEQLYSTRARLYEKVFVNQLGWGKELDAFFRRSAFLYPSMKILDAGCGTGIVTRILHKIMHEKGFGAEFHAFDLTQSMLDIFGQEIREKGLENVELAQVDVLRLDTLPATWKEYDIIVSSALLEHIPEDQINRAVRNLRALVKEGGVLLLFLTRRTIITRLTGKLLWKTNLFEEANIKVLLEGLGFHRIEFKTLQSGWANHIIVVEACK
jgi:2-polyprenyl-3-methyl-5-hydroxy-6-metoxy-1,4-benzoquinol methylase